MRTVQDLVLGFPDQELAFDAPEGRPLSVDSVEVFRAGSSDASPIAAVDSFDVEDAPDVELADAAGAATADPRLVTLDDIAGVEPGRTYLIASATGQRELVEVDTVNEDDDLVVAKHPLHGVYADGDTFQSTRMIAVINDDWAADSSNVDGSTGPNPMYRVRWVYTVGDSVLSRQCVVDTYFNLVRYQGRHAVRPQDVDNFAPGFLDRLPTDHRSDEGVRLIDEAFRAVKLDLHGINIDDAAIAESEIVDELVRYKTVERLAFANFIAGKESDPARLREAERAYSMRLEQLLKLADNTPIRDVATGIVVISPTRSLTER